MKFGVVVFPGSNCDEDVCYALDQVLGQKVERLWHKEHLPADFTSNDCIILPGGFSYGDYLRAGAIARLSPIMSSVRTFSENGGMVIGICNGFQILCEAGLLPGGLLRNLQQKFVCKNVYLKPMTSNAAITAGVGLDKVLKIPIAHAEGRYYANPGTLKQLVEKDQILFKYCLEDGVIDDHANPNGSVDNIAGVCNENRNVFGMMPHPERAMEEIFRNTDGRLLFESVLNYSSATLS